MKSEPSRTCLGCREARPKSRLVRLIRARTGIVVVDAAGRAAGRGAYVCPDAACVERALIRGRLAHAFRKPCVASPDLAVAVAAASRPVPKNRGGDAAGVRETDAMTARG
jgi:predicted RNA-binding protein YlxR (DUF448 family)